MGNREFITGKREIAWETVRGSLVLDKTNISYKMVNHINLFLLKCTVLQLLKKKLQALAE